MRLFIYDVEVFRYDWLIVFKDHESSEYTVIHNDNEAVKNFLDDDAIYFSFNGKFYDQYIVKAICAGASPEELKELNDFIIGGGLGWQHPIIRESFFYMNNVDVRDDMQMGLSLKAIEGHLGLSVEETTVPFDIDRPLTPAELEDTIRYCKHDVDTTEKLVELRKDYLNGKVSVGRMKGISDARAMGMTNAKLTAAFLGARAIPHGDEREYEYPPNLARDFIPPEVFDFFDRIRNPTVPDDVLFKSKLEITVGDCPVTLAYGGIHGALPCYNEEAQGKRVIRNYDVASLYPSLMINCGYVSRNIPSAKSFEEVYHTRLNAKKNGDKATANALKLILNTTYGAMLNQYNDLFDPRMGRAVCISGQLFLLELAAKYVFNITTAKLIQINTDGIMISLEDWELPALAAINDEWQQRTGFVLEEDVIERIIQKDVNNYFEVKDGGHVKTKGGYLSYGIAPAGAFNINNNAVIVKKAIIAYFTDGTPVEKTIEACDDIFEFQMIAKAGTKYREAYHLVNGEKVPVQKVNRVYASLNPDYRKLYKVKAETDATAKIEMLPENCVIDNDNHLTIADVDKSFYIQMAQKRINDFMGIKPEKKGRTKKMATAKKEPDTRPMNVHQKLLKAREMFLAAAVKKTGKNMEMAFKYFELQDIVPVATRIFSEVGLLPVVALDSEIGVMEITNVDNPEESVEITAPMRVWEGNRGTGVMQALGASITYMRRYLYMIALDICEPDDIDGTATKDAAPAAKPPVSPEKREEVKNNLTDPNGGATELQIRQLKNVLKQLKEKDPTKETLVQKIALDTKGFTEISKATCEGLIVKLTAALGSEASA